MSCIFHTWNRNDPLPDYPLETIGYYMFADERATNRLKMCSDCRVIDMAEDPNTAL